MSAPRRDAGEALPRVQISRTLSCPPVMLGASMELALITLMGSVLAVLGAVLLLGLPAIALAGILPPHLWAVTTTSRDPNAMQVFISWTRIPRLAGIRPGRWGPVEPGVRRRLAP